jgi:glucose/arabinose dehydrogenase/PKD repeat protein
MRRLTLLTISTAVAVLLLVAAAGNVRPAHALSVVPQGFTQTYVVGPPFSDPRAFDLPHDIEFAPDGRLFVAQQNGIVKILNPDGTISTFLDISNQVHYANSFGLLGIALDPQFATNRFVYLFYTAEAEDTNGDGVVDIPLHNVIVRVTANASGDSAVPGSEQLLLRLDDLEDNGLHNGGSIKFGADGKLYASVGENNRRTPAQTLDNFFGKVVRINKDGTIPTDNPFYDTASGDYRAIWALGLRNPYKMDVQRGTGTIFVDDVGGTKWEEINRGAAGANYGWPVTEGVANDPRYVDPLFAYPHDETGTIDPNTTGCAIIGSTFYDPKTAQFPSEYAGDYFFSDWCNDWIRRYDPATDQATLFATESFNPIDLEVSEDGSLYVMQRRGALIKIQFTGDANRPPNSAIAANPTSGPVPLAVDFDGSGSSDPDTGDTLSYVWDFGDGSPTETTATPTTSHTYSTKGTYAASLRVRDNHGALSDPDTVRIDAGNEAPDPTIGSPSADLLFKVGQQITLSGSATDPEDGALPDSAFRWDVLLWHNNSHTHPIFSGTGNNLTFTAPQPEDLFSATGPGNYLEIRFTATDSTGLSKTTTRDVQPNRVNLTFGSNPGGLSLEADHQAFVAPKTLVSWEGYKPLVNAPSPQTLSGTTYEFSSWSDAGTQQHQILTGAAPSTYTATYTATSAACTISGTSGNDTLKGTIRNDVICGLGGDDNLKGVGGDDKLLGGDGNDILVGGAGNDSVDGAAGTDRASFGGTTAVSASLATNSATGVGSDTLTAIENLTGSSANDTLTGNSGPNQLSGTGGNDTERGGGGNDNVVGGGGDDDLYGEDGDDTVNSRDGVAGNDLLDGGAGTDKKVTDATERSVMNFP